MGAAPLVWGARFAVMTGIAVWQNWDTIQDLWTRYVEEPEADDWGRYAQFIFGMKDSGGNWTPRERGMFGIHYINTTGGELDHTWTTGDFTAVESAASTLFSSNAGAISNACRLEEVRWYKFGPKIFPPNPPVRVFTYGTPIAGTSTGTWIRQVSMTATFRTPLRRHWGRIYFPLVTDQFSSQGQLSATQVGNFKDWMKTFLAAPSSAGVVPVVYDRNRKAVLGIDQLQVDSVPDIIRRRRPRTTLARSTEDI